MGRTGSLAEDPDPDLGDLVAVKEVEVDNSNNKRRQVEDRAEEVLGVNNSSMVGTISSHSWPRDPPNLKVSTRMIQDLPFSHLIVMVYIHRPRRLRLQLLILMINIPIIIVVIIINNKLRLRRRRIH